MDFWTSCLSNSNADISTILNQGSPCYVANPITSSMVRRNEGDLSSVVYSNNVTIKNNVTIMAQRNDGDLNGLVYSSRVSVPNSMPENNIVTIESEDEDDVDDFFDYEAYENAINYDEDEENNDVIVIDDVNDEHNNAVLNTSVEIGNVPVGMELVTYKPLENGVAVNQQAATKVETRYRPSEKLKQIIQRAVIAAGQDQLFVAPEVEELSQLGIFCSSSFQRNDRDIKNIIALMGSHRIAFTPNDEIKFSLLDRVRGWSACIKPRVTEPQTDAKYSWTVKKKNFRSQVQVIRFILYENQNLPFDIPRNVSRKSSNASKKGRVSKNKRQNGRIDKKSSLAYHVITEESKRLNYLSQCYELELLSIPKKRRTGSCYMCDSSKLGCCFLCSYNNNHRLN